MQFGGRQRRGEQETLQLGTAGLAQEGGLFGGFHALGDHRLVQPARHRDDRAGDRGGVRIADHVAHEHTVDLQGVDREVLQVGKAAVAGAEVVQRQPHAALPDTAQQAAGGVAAGHHHALGQLEFEQARVEAGLFQHLVQPVMEISMLELHRRHIHRHRDGMTELLPRARLLARLAQHPGADRQDQPGVLGHRDELVGLVQLAPVHMPAQQGLGADDAAVAGIDLGLVVKRELLPWQGLAQGGLDAAAGQLALVHRGGEEAVAVAALAADRRHRGFAVLQQAFRVVRIIRIHADADAQVQAQVGDAFDRGLLALVDQVLRQAGRLAHAVQVRQHHHELVAALAAEQCIGGQAALQPGHQRAQHAIAAGVAVLLVDLAQLVDVDVQQRHAMLAAQGHGDRAGKVVMQLAAVGQAGQRIVLGEVDQLQRQRARFADIVEHQHAADHVAGVVMDRRGGILHRRVEAVPVAQQGAPGEIHDGVVFDRRAQRVVDRPPVAGIEQLEHFLDRPPPRLRVVPAGHRLGDGVERADAQFRVGGDHGVADRSQGDLGQLAFAVQRILERLARGDVLRLRHEIQRPALLVAYQRHAELDVHHAAILVQVALFQLVVFTLADQQLQHLLRVGSHVVRMGDVGDAQLQQFVLGVAEHLAHRGVDAQEAAVRAGQRHADGGVLERAEKALFALVQLQLKRAPLGDVDEGGEHAAYAALVIEVGLEIAVRVAALALAAELTLATGRLAGIRLVQRRAGGFVVARTGHVDQAPANDGGGFDAEPAAVGVVDVAKALFVVEVGQQHRCAMHDPGRPARPVRQCRQPLGVLVRPHGHPVSSRAPPCPAHGFIMRRLWMTTQLAPNATPGRCDREVSAVR